MRPNTATLQRGCGQNELHAVAEIAKTQRGGREGCSPLSLHFAPFKKIGSQNHRVHASHSAHDFPHASHIAVVAGEHGAHQVGRVERC